MTTRPASETLWSVAAAFIERAGGGAEHFQVVGGLVPSKLVSGSGVMAHLGTNDVDISVALVEGATDLGAVEDALHHEGLQRAPGREGWGYMGAIDGVPIILELLCDRDGLDDGQTIPLPGCRTAKACNFSRTPLRSARSSHRSGAPSRRGNDRSHHGTRRISVFQGPCTG